MEEVGEVAGFGLGVVEAEGAGRNTGGDEERLVWVWQRHVEAID